MYQKHVTHQPHRKTKNTSTIFLKELFTHFKVEHQRGPLSEEAETVKF